jgi:hypothetical protein
MVSKSIQPFDLCSWGRKKKIKKKATQVYISRMYRATQDFNQIRQFLRSHGLNQSFKISRRLEKGLNSTGG